MSPIFSDRKITESIFCAWILYETTHWGPTHKYNILCIICVCRKCNRLIITACHRFRTCGIGWALVSGEFRIFGHFASNFVAWYLGMYSLSTRIRGMNAQIMHKILGPSREGALSGNTFVHLSALDPIFYFLLKKPNKTNPYHRC